MTEVDLFISTQRIKVLSTDTQVCDNIMFKLIQKHYMTFLQDLSNSFFCA